MEWRHIFELKDESNKKKCVTLLIVEMYFLYLKGGRNGGYDSRENG